MQKHMIDLNLQDYEERTVLHWLAQVSDRKPGDKAKLNICFRLILGSDSCPSVDVDFRDVWENIALYTAMECDFLERVKLLFSNGDDIMALKREVTKIKRYPINNMHIRHCYRYEKIQYEKYNKPFRLQETVIHN